MTTFKQTFKERFKDAQRLGRLYRSDAPLTDEQLAEYREWGERDIRVTALLNLYHDLKGTGHHHSIENCRSPWLYQRYYDEAKQETQEGKLMFK